MKIDKLTPEQEALIPVYREKWRKIAESTEPLDCRKARKAVKAAYKLIGRKEPKLIFVKSPAAAWRYIICNSSSLVEYEELLRCFGLEMTSKPKLKIASQIGSLVKLSTVLFVRLNHGVVAAKIREMFDGKTWKDFLYRCGDFNPESVSVDVYFDGWEWGPSLGSSELVERSGYIDYCISVLNCKYDIKRWNTYQQLIQHTGWIFPFERTCLVCVRPTHLSFDSEQRLHGEGNPAIEYVDGFSMYSYHGVTLPEKYGKVHPQQWEAKWLLEEENAELRRVLIEGIGYTRICQELQAIEFHSWQGYTVLRILDRRADREPIYLLKMICPSTGHIHALRIPPTIRSATEAIRWVNWGVDPEEFQVQT